MRVNEMIAQALRDLHNATEQNLRQERECSLDLANRLSAVMQKRDDLAAFLRKLCDEHGQGQEWYADALALLERTGNKAMR